ncbi:MerR family transcriptional regulator [Nannocystis punicea]|uniref:MerR family transcriptional regulator n=1 Tax=Nannocystis punicea TaxID=2995304 RepID=A0ABY7H5G0_9BACT|nr:MerR family transcriptional regulator [Nannocystis poenicansa]WAS94528.1 MerR family transcriptional regulator [Nannocystis poenicansa]
MFEDSWKPKPVPKDYVLVEELSEVAGVDRKSLLEWGRAGLLPKPQSSRGRGIVSKWPRIALELAKVVRKYREQGFGLLEIRPYLIKAFGERILEVLPEPTIPTRKRGRKPPAPSGSSVPRQDNPTR